MEPVETYTKLYDEALEREHGKDRYKPGFGTVWNNRSAAAQRMARKRDAAVAEAIDGYVESVTAFDDTQRILESPHRHREDAYRMALPEELVSNSEIFDYFGVEADDTQYEVRVQEWITLNIDPIAEADDARQFERKLRSNVDRIDADRIDGYTATQLNGMYDQWSREDRAWAETLWTFVTDADLGVRDMAEERRRHNREIAAHAQNLVDLLGEHLDAYAEHDGEQPSRLQQFKNRFL